MQLKKHRKANGNLTIRCLLSTATCSLLSSPTLTAHAAENPEEGQWNFDTAVLLYAETDSRVQAVEPVIKARKGLANDAFLDFKLVVDSLTGASPTGAVPSSQLQVFTRPSGDATYVIQAGEVPLDDTFLDTRTALSANWERPLNNNTRMNLGANLSSEYDFQSLSCSANFSHDLNQRNTTLAVGIAMEADTIEPEGGIPREYTSALIAASPLNRRADSEKRDQIDLLLGITQVISQHTLMQLNLSYSQSDGYHNDPFKMISIVNASGVPLDNIFEQRPDTRSKTAIFWRALHSFETDSLDISYRYMTDNWGIKSHTLDLRYNWMQKQGAYWQPHLRFYQQAAADFYTTLLPDSAMIPADISADYRLGDMRGLTLGIKYSMPVAEKNRMEFRLEMLSQNNDPSSGSNIGIQANQQQILDTKASLFQFSYSF